jgi:nucleoside 2-deoxyribosyltransferase
MTVAGSLAQHRCRSPPWLQEPPNAEAGDRAVQDLRDIFQADTIVFIQDPVSLGKHVEFGYAVAKNKNIILIGDGTGCIFYMLPWVKIYPNVDDFITDLSDYIAEWKENISHGPR